MPSSLRAPIFDAIELTADEREALEAWVRGRKTSQALAERARIVLACAGSPRANKSVAKELSINRVTVGKWRARFLERRLDGLVDEPRPGQPRKISDAHVERVVTKTLESLPRGATHWSTRVLREFERLGPVGLAVRAWLLKRPRFRIHFTPTSASWIDLVERWFASLTEKQLRRGVHRSTRALEEAIRAFLDVHNENPRPFVWTKTADQILDNLRRYCERINDSGH